MIRKFFSLHTLSKNNSYNSFLKTIKRFNFDQYKERSKRHFVLIYRYTDDMHYKRSKQYN